MPPTENQDQLIKLVKDITQASTMLTTSVESLRNVVARDLVDGQKALLDSVEEITEAIVINTECLENCKNKERCSTILNTEHAIAITELKSLLSDEEKYGLKSLLKGIHKVIDVIKYFVVFATGITVIVGLYQLIKAYLASKGTH